MRRQTALPRISREGWVPAGPDKRVNKGAMLIPKTGQPSDHLPTIYDFCDAPRERRVLREIVETGDLIRENGHTYLVARVSSYTVDTLAAFESERADLEDGADAELVNEDGTNESAADWQETGPGRLEARRGYIAARQERYRMTYNSKARDQDEIRVVQSQLDALAAKKRKPVNAERSERARKAAQACWAKRDRERLAGETRP